MHGRTTRLLLGTITLTLSTAQVGAQNPPPPRNDLPAESRPSVPPPPTAEPPHWHDRHGLAVPMEPGPSLPPWLTSGDVYIRADLGTHREHGFPERDGLGIELNGRIAFPDSPWISAIGTLRNGFMDGSDRLSWTLGGMGDWGVVKAGGGIDGIFDSLSDTHVGSGFIFVSYELLEFKTRVGLWSTFQLWDDFHEVVMPVIPGVFEVLTFGVKPYEHTSVFLAGALGPEGRWGEIVFAPGIEHTDGRLRFSVGFQGSIVENVDAFIYYHQTAAGDRDWSIFAGLQLHLGCGGPRPFDFTMPQLIRARQKFSSGARYVAF